MLRKGTIWTIVLLVGAYLVAQAVADVAATKFVTMWRISLPAGSILFALTFTIRDLIHKRLGKEWARAAIVIAALFNILQALYLSWMAAMDAPPFYAYTEAWSAIFAIVPSITVASIIAEVCSELVDTEIYHFWYEHVVDKSKWPQWTAVLASNLVSLPLDSLIFGVLAFTVLPTVFGGETLPVLNSLALVAGQIVWKALVTLVSMPAIYAVPKRKLSDLAYSMEG